jgi:molybdopterin/thiamine biosynthesis adenylyltransferase
MEKEIRHVVVAGAGGNTGSHLMPHLARLPEVGRITLVDPDDYELANVAVQNIERLDVGRPKVAVQAERIARINPNLEVAALQERIEDVPRGLIQCDLFVSCLDSKVARQHVNEIAWRLGKPWFDCGVLGSQNLARVNAYLPSESAPCLECSWGTDQYAVLEQEYLCSSVNSSGFPSMASSGLGALAASLLAIDIGKLLRSGVADSLVSREVIFDAQHYTVQITAGRRNPWCRFDHRTWFVEPWRCRLETTTVESALNALGGITVDGHWFAAELNCPGCGLCQKSMRLNRPRARCMKCRRRMVSSGFGSLERLDSSTASDYSALTLEQIGLRDGDIVSASDRHYQVREVAA